MVWSGLSGPPLSPSPMPRMNMVTYSSSTRSPVSASLLVTLMVKRVPDDATRTLYASDDVVMRRPGTSGWWNHMSCSPWTIIMSASDGTTSPTAKPIASHVGTTPNTGGAYLPEPYASLSSLVAAAYAFARSGSIVSVRSSYVVPSFSSGSAMGSPPVSSVGGRTLPEVAAGRPGWGTRMVDWCP